MRQKKLNFFQWLIDKFFPQDDDEAFKRRMLKNIAKEISKNRYSRWYKQNTSDLLPAFGKVMYEIYKIVGPARSFLMTTLSSQVFKTITVEYFLSDKAHKLKDQLDQEFLLEQSKTLSVAAIEAEAKKKLAIISAEFTADKIQEIDLVYEHMDSFIHFVLYDYYFLLKKLDPTLPEGDFSYVPQFEPTNALFLLEDLKDFAVILYSLPLEINWSKLFEIITVYKNIRPVNETQWTRLIKLLSDIRRSNIFEKIIQHISKDPTYKIESVPFNEKIAEAYFTRLKQTSEATIRKLQQEQKKAKMEYAAKNIFSDRSASGMKNYTSAANNAFKRRGLKGFTHTTEMDYLKIFLLDFFKADIRALSDLFLVRGNWGQQELSKNYSESYHTLMQICDKVLEFDENLSEGSDLGVKFRTLLSRSEREPGAAKQAMNLSEKVNDTAYKLLKISVKHLIVIGNNFKDIIADYDKPHRTLIQNWKEIEQHSDRPVKEWLTDAYKKIYNFVLLIRMSFN
ncbi:DUF5312 family protein [Treponema phagedenis]|uniref:DUF5312 family protein n=1 Tax=Treponema phagedenis TaxID=162 RepID=UPI0001F64213|nr:DUF5312 family protein [Treponema phagedenis]EFW39316.1 hypothetical protein HMPREF9554_00183 [Treponema phagedenis F0421]TYT78096.1 hypothetical protein FS559_02610 [Treponema phagedenis]